MGYYDTLRTRLGIGMTGPAYAEASVGRYPDFMDMEAERRRRTRESLGRPGPVLRTSQIEPMRIASGGYIPLRQGYGGQGSQMSDERAMGMFADRSGTNAAARAGLNVGRNAEGRMQNVEFGSRGGEMTDQRALQMARDYESRTGHARTRSDASRLESEAEKRYGLRMEDTGPWAGSVSNAYLQYKASNMMNSIADRKAAQAELSRRNAREAQTEQIGGNVAVAAEQAKGVAAVNQIRLDVADRAAQAKENAAGITGQSRENVAETKAAADKYKTDTNAQNQLEITRARIAGDIDKVNTLTLAQKDIAQLNAETNVAVAELKKSGQVEAAEKLAQARSLNKGIDPFVFMQATPDERKLLLMRAGMEASTTVTPPVPPTAPAAASTTQTSTVTPPRPDAKQAPDGKWYIPDPNRPGKYLQVT